MFILHCLIGICAVGLLVQMLCLLDDLVRGRI